MSTVERFIVFRKRKVKRKGGRVPVMFSEFYSLPNAKEADMLSICSKNELITLLNDLEAKGKYSLESDRLKIFKKLLIYAAVRQTIRKAEKALDLGIIVKNLGLYETHFWASVLTETFRRTLSRKFLYRPSKAFKILYGLDVK
ncbi:MAG: hypothetical protein NDF54_11390 [archaeon GB-1867-035]|nr:hypothetical protein [Candidatus Culexmicrobium profundum]